MMFSMPSVWYHTVLNTLRSPAKVMAAMMELHQMYMVQSERQILVSRWGLYNTLMMDCISRSIQLMGVVLLGLLKSSELLPWWISESFQLQMGFSFPFLHANNLRSSLLIMRARSFLLSCMQGVHTQGQCTVGTKIFFT